MFRAVAGRIEGSVDNLPSGKLLIRNNPVLHPGFPFGHLTDLSRFQKNPVFTAAQRLVLGYCSFSIQDTILKFGLGKTVF